MQRTQSHPREEWGETAPLSFRPAAVQPPAFSVYRPACQTWRLDMVQVKPPPAAVNMARCPQQAIGPEPRRGLVSSLPTCLSCIRVAHTRHLGSPKITKERVCKRSSPRIVHRLSDVSATFR